MNNIENWISENCNFSGSYEIVDGKVNINGNIYINNKDINELPFAFGNVTGTFSCSKCQLETLENCPETCGDFACNSCLRLKSLAGAPKRVERDFMCAHCLYIESLEGSPEYVGGRYICSSCDAVTDLKGSPEYVGGDMECNYMDNLESLYGLPGEIGGKLFINNNYKLITTDEYIHDNCRVTEIIKNLP